MTTCSPLEPEKRSLALERIAARLSLQGVFGDHDVNRAISASWSD
jgi:hypothetical protein